MTTATTRNKIDYSELQERLKSRKGREYWRSLEELAKTPEFQQQMAEEFSSQQEKWIDPVTRRNFLKLMGASIAFSGLTACDFQKPDELILPYVKQPEQLVLGKSLFFATAIPYNGFGYPVLVESHEGRPTKIEGNPDHPYSQGATFAWMQGSILSLYDPDRSQIVLHNGAMDNWGGFVEGLRLALSKLSGGEGLRILTETVTSPTLAWQMEQVMKQHPAAKWVQYDPCGRDNVREGARLAFGDYADTHYRFDKADVVLALDSDFMVEGPSALRYSKEFSRRRRVRTTQDAMARLYVVEHSLTCTGSIADHRLPLKPSDVVRFASSLAAAVGVAGVSKEDAAPDQKFLDAVVKDLQANKGKAVVTVGDDAPAVLHALAHAINAALGAVGQTVVYSDPVEVRPSNQAADLAALVADMNAGKVHALLILGGNPVYNTPVDLNFTKALEKVAFRAHLSESVDETSSVCHWHVPQAHFLETWSDIRVADGSVSIVQPLIAPLFGAKSSHELLANLHGQAGQSGFDIVQGYWKSQRPADATFDKSWRRALHDGFVVNTSAKERSVTAKTDAAAFPKSPAVQGMELILRADSAIRDGRFANCGWLQELPKAFTKVTWDNVALISPRTAAELKLQTEDLVKLKVGTQSVNMPICVMAGHADNCMTVQLGFGRAKAGRVAINDEGHPHGHNSYVLLHSHIPATGGAVTVQAGLGKYLLARTQTHFTIDNIDIPAMEKANEFESLKLKHRGLVRRASLEEYRKDEHFAAEQGPPAPHRDMDLYAGAWRYDHKTPDGKNMQYAWGMVIDTSACHGCNACVAACVAENNIPVVGKNEVRRQHEMHWLRIDQYYTGDLENPEVYNQPLPCMHCENAPCEVVCPVAATTHSEQGTNDMIYNRCVGTRFCSNNCPYKVRRFNYFQYADFHTPIKKMLNNPDVSVRSRGVMEKCTYCIQRIAQGRIEAENEGRRVKDGEIVTACAATCPTDAIIFGDINDPNSQVAKLKANPLSYGLLVDLNTKPRTTYMAAVRNENPDIPKVASEHAAPAKKEHKA
ncbi:MAG: TAT-variant-translocated molybdopterin oxidoreductase [Candidatus Sumerlaeaceae bacterium]